MKYQKEIEEWLKKPVSWSCISSFEWDPEQWFETYILGKRQSTRELEFGSVIDQQFQDDPAFLPDLPRHGLLQYKMKAKLGKLELVGVPDDVSFELFKLFDLKTGKKAWDQKRADETGQLTMYLLLIWLTKKIRPEEFECGIHWLPTEERGDFTIQLVEPCVPQTFYTKRTMRDILDFGVRIEKRVKEMKAYAEAHA